MERITVCSEIFRVTADTADGAYSDHRAPKFISGSRFFLLDILKGHMCISQSSFYL
jgi:hypothetical protein